MVSLHSVRFSGAMATSTVGSATAQVEGGHQPPVNRARRIDNGHITEAQVERRFRSAVLTARTCGASEVSMDWHGTVTVTVKHSKECIPPAVVEHEKSFWRRLLSDSSNSRNGFKGRRQHDRWRHRTRLPA